MDEDNKKDVTITDDGAGNEPEKENVDTSGDGKQTKGKGGAEGKGGKESGNDGDGKKPAAKADEPRFTQAEVDEMLGNRAKRANAKFLKDNGMTEQDVKDFKTWKDSQKTAEEKHAADLRTANERADKAEKELSRMSRLESVRKSGVDEKFIKFVTHEAAQLAEEKEIDFDEALAVYMKGDGQDYKKQENTNTNTNTKKPDEKPTDKGAPIKTKSGADVEAEIKAAFKKRR